MICHNIQNVVAAIEWHANDWREAMLAKHLIGPDVLKPDLRLCLSPPGLFRNDIRHLCFASRDFPRSACFEGTIWKSGVIGRFEVKRYESCMNIPLPVFFNQIEEPFKTKLLEELDMGFWFGSLYHGETREFRSLDELLVKWAIAGSKKWEFGRKAT